MTIPVRRQGRLEPLRLAMDEAIHLGPDLREARGGFVCRFERQRLDARPGAILWRALPFLAAAAFVAAPLVADAFPGPRWLQAAAGAAVCCAPLCNLAWACLAGVRAFGNERARGTLDALMMTPLERYDLVQGRFAAHLRGPLLFFWTALAATLILLGEEDPLGAMLITALAGAWYHGLLLLAGALGLFLGLRLGAAGRALAAALALLVAACATEFALVYGFVLIAGSFAPALALFVLAGAIGFQRLGASVLLHAAECRFEPWAMGRLT